MTDLLSAIHLAQSLSLWPLHRYGVVLLSMLMLEMEGADLASRARAQILEIHDQVSMRCRRGREVRRCQADRSDHG